MTRQDRWESRRGRPWTAQAAIVLVALAGVLVVLAATAAPASASGTLTVVVHGPGDVNGSGIDCDETGGDCTQSYTDTQICDPERKPPCFTIPAVATVTAGDRGGTGFTFDHWTGCDEDSGASCTAIMNSSQTVHAFFRDNTGPSVTLTEPAATAPRRGGELAGGKIDAKVTTFWRLFGKRTVIRTLTVKNAPVGSKVTVSCKGKGCTFKRVVLTVTRAKLALAKRFKRKRLAAGTVVTITVAKEGMVAKTFRYKLRAKRFPTLALS